MGQSSGYAGPTASPVNRTWSVADPSASVSPDAYAGMAQGADGTTQGFMGSVVGQATGPQTSTTRAAIGGMEADPMGALINHVMRTAPDQRAQAPGDRDPSRRIFNLNPHGPRVL